MGKVIIVFVLFVAVFIYGAKIWRENQIDAAWESGRKSGYEVGYAEIRKEYEPKLETQKNLYERKIQTLKKEYDKKILTAEAEGLAMGKKNKLEEINKTIENKAEENKTKGKWDAVLFEVK